MLAGLIVPDTRETVMHDSFCDRPQGLIKVICLFLAYAHIQPMRKLIAKTS